MDVGLGVGRLLFVEVGEVGLLWERGPVLVVHDR